MSSCFFLGGAALLRMTDILLSCYIAHNITVLILSLVPVPPGTQNNSSVEILPKARTDGDGGDAASSLYRLVGGNGGAIADLGRYDAVVIATPFAFSQLEIKDEAKQDLLLKHHHHQEQQQHGEKEGIKAAPEIAPKVYQTTITTYVEGSIRKGRSTASFSLQLPIVQRH